MKMLKLFFSVKDVRADFLELTESNHQLYLSFKDNESFSIRTQIEGLILPDGYDIIRTNDFVSENEGVDKESKISISNHLLANI
jgi:hypothetical protein